MDLIFIIIIVAMGIVLFIQFIVIMLQKANFGSVFKRGVRGIVLSSNKRYKIQPVWNEKSALITKGYKEIYDSPDNSIYSGPAGDLAIIADEANTAMNVTYSQYIQHLADGGIDGIHYTGIDDVRMSLYETKLLDDPKSGRKDDWIKEERVKLTRARGYYELQSAGTQTETTLSKDGQVASTIKTPLTEQLEPMDSREYNSFIRDIDHWLSSVKTQLLVDSKLKIDGHSVTFNGLLPWMKSSPQIVNRKYWFDRGIEYQKKTDSGKNTMILYMAFAMGIIIVCVGFVSYFFK